jgi:hypothetical protein
VGKALAALVAAGIGSAALGVLTTLAELSARLKNVLNIYDPVGPLSGKPTLPVIIWLIAWYVLARRWHVRPPVMKSALSRRLSSLGRVLWAHSRCSLRCLRPTNDFLLRRSAARWSEPPQRSSKPGWYMACRGHDIQVSRAGTVARGSRIDGFCSTATGGPMRARTSFWQIVTSSHS